MVLLLENGASCVEEPSIWTSGATTLNKEATGSSVRRIFTQWGQRYYGLNWNIIRLNNIFQVSILQKR